MILGHLTVTAAAHRIIKRRVWPSLPIALLPLVIGAYVPDLVDKSLARLTGLAGRGYGHSIVVQAVVFGAAALLASRHRKVVAALAIGAVIHLIEDTVALPVLFAPLLGPIPFMPHYTLLESLILFYGGGGPVVWIEVWSFVYWTIVGVQILAAKPRIRDTAPAPEAASFLAGPPGQ